jgi:hypothetical protein
MRRRVAIVVSSLSLCLGLTGCLWFGMATVGGTVTGLPTGTSVILQNNGKDNLTLTQNGRFTFNNTLDDGDDYNVTVLTQPGTATCTPTNNTGKINSKGDDVENVLVTCAATGNITGTVTGVPAGTAATLLLTLPSSTATVVVSADGNFAFSGIQPNGTHYVVTVQTPPSGRTCTVQNGDANVVTGTPTNIVITCT